MHIKTSAAPIQVYFLKKGVKDESCVWIDEVRCATSLCLKMVLCIHLPPLPSLQPVTMVFPRCLLVSLYCPWGCLCMCSWGYSFQHLLSCLLIAAAFPSLQQDAPFYSSVPNNSFTLGPWAVAIIQSQLNKGKKSKPMNLFPLHPNIQLEEKPKHISSSLPDPKTLAKKAVFHKNAWKSGLFESGEESWQITNLNIFHTSSTNLCFSPRENPSN